jgi:hypothetical protein
MYGVHPRECTKRPHVAHDQLLEAHWPPSILPKNVGWGNWNLRLLTGYTCTSESDCSWLACGVWDRLLEHARAPLPSCALHYPPTAKLTASVTLIARLSAPKKTSNMLRASIAQGVHCTWRRDCSPSWVGCLLLHKECIALGGVTVRLHGWAAYYCTRMTSK